MADDPAPAPSAADVEAARANASANAAAEAAAAATSMAEVGAARANNEAAERVAAFEGRLNEWQTRTEAIASAQADDRSQRETLFGAMQSQLGELQQSLQSIQERLAPPPAPNPPNPENGPPAVAPPAVAPPAPEPAPAPKRKAAHRWI